MSIKSILKKEQGELLKKLSNLSRTYNFWYTTTTISDLKSIIDNIEEVEKELDK